ncbi:hypothetical protein Pam4_39 [Pseudanabaena phage Pam4]|nr:hypothetical protein Pam4_39 [Pseudanabaena phage Pam4]
MIETLTSYLLTFAAGIATGAFVTWAVGLRLLHEPTHEGPHPHRRRLPVVVLALIGAFVLVAGFGVQQRVAQQNDREVRERLADQTACLNTWGRRLVDRVENRAAGAQAVERAEAAREDALDSIVLIVTALRAIPPQAQQADLDRVLRAFAVAKTRKDLAEERLERVRQRNPYPTPSC